MGAVAKGVASLFGGRGRRRDERRTKAGYEAAEANLMGQEFTNAFAGLEGRSYTPGTFEAQTAQAGQLGPAAQGQVARLGSARGYEAQGYDSQGYDAQGYTAGQTNVAGLARGADTGLTNTMRNLQVSTAGAELAAQEADQSLAASQDIAAQTGTGAGGATALAAAAVRSKSGIRADIDKQVKQNEMLRARGESEFQRAQLAQGNIASQFDLGQSQFNVGAQNTASRFGAQAQNQAAQFTAGAANQAAQFGAQAQNEAARFGAQSANQFALAQFGAENAMERSNVASRNQFAQQQFGADNQFALANMAAQNQGQQFNIGNQIGADRFEAQTDIRAAELGAQGDMRIQDMEYARNRDTLDRRLAEYQGAKEARSQATADLVGGIGGILDAGMTMLSPGGILNK